MIYEEDPMTARLLDRFVTPAAAAAAVAARTAPGAVAVRGPSESAAQPPTDRRD